MRIEKKCYESCSFNEAGEKDIKLRNDAEIILSMEDVKEMICNLPLNLLRDSPIFKDLSETYLQAKKEIA